jgi:polyamine oxidase
MTLSRKGVPYIILEARDRYGGRVLNHKISGVELDLGASWVHSYSKNNPIAKEVKKLNWKPRKS